MLKLHYFKIEIRNRAGGGETICPRRRQFDPKNAADLRPSENAVATPGLWNKGEVRYGSIGGLEYEVPQKLTHLLQCIGNL